MLATETFLQSSSYPDDFPDLPLPVQQSSSSPSVSAFVTTHSGRVALASADNCCHFREEDLLNYQFNKHSVKYDQCVAAKSYIVKINYVTLARNYPSGTAPPWRVGPPRPQHIYYHWHQATQVALYVISASVPIYGGHVGSRLSIVVQTSLYPATFF